MLHQSSAEAGGGGTAGQECRKLGTDMNFWRILPEIRCLSPVCPPASAAGNGVLTESKVGRLPFRVEYLPTDNAKRFFQ
jgi:hypothetical protein